MSRTFYPLGDRVPGSRMGDGKQYHGIRTGEFRAPRAGEWYLSGAYPEAYRAKNDLDVQYHICEIVRTRTKHIIDIVRVEES